MYNQFTVAFVNLLPWEGENKRKEKVNQLGAYS